MTTSFAAKCDILAAIYLEIQDTQDFGDYLPRNNPAIQLALNVELGYAKATDMGVELIEKAWQELLEFLGNTDEGYADYEEFWYPQDYYADRRK
jgi:hypothetical protein